MINSTLILANALIKVARHHTVPPEGIPLAPASWINEFRTVKVGVPRQSGKTSAVVALAAENVNYVLGANDYIARHLSQQLKRTVQPVQSLGGLVHQMLLAEVPKGVELLLVDEGLMLEKTDRDLVTEFAADLWIRGIANHHKFVVVYIGT